MIGASIRSRVHNLESVYTCSQIHFEAHKSVQEASKQVIRRRMTKLRKSLILKRAGSRVRTDDLLITNRILLVKSKLLSFPSTISHFGSESALKAGRTAYLDAGVVAPYCHNRARKLSGNCPTPQKAHMRTAVTASKKWEGRCFRYSPDNPSAIYYIKLMFRRRRETFSTGTPIKAAAGVVARKIFMSLQSDGWDETIAKYAPHAQAQPVITVGGFCAKLQAVYTGRKRTINDYCRNFRRLVADIAGIDRDAKKYDYVNGGRDEWLTKVNRVRLTEITREAIEAWRAGYLAKAGEDMERLRSARTSCNSMLRQCKSLFSIERLELLKLEIESPFAKIKLDRVGDMRFKGGIDAAALVKAAVSQLAGDSEVLKAFILTLACGLRRSEADKLEWSAIDFERAILHVGPTKFLRPKSEKSIGDIDLDTATVGLLRGFYAKRQSNFVLESTIAPRLAAGYSHYRAHKTFERLLAWLRAQGIKNRTPIHTLRKLFGSLICEEFGIFAASSALRHSSIAITGSHYIVKRGKTSVKLESLLSEGDKVIPMPKKRGSVKASARAASA
jgi:integrase